MIQRPSRISITACANYKNCYKNAAGTLEMAPDGWAKVIESRRKSITFILPTSSEVLSIPSALCSINLRWPKPKQWSVPPRFSSKAKYTGFVITIWWPGGWPLWSRSLGTPTVDDRSRHSNKIDPQVKLEAAWEYILVTQTFFEFWKCIALGEERLKQKWQQKINRFPFYWCRSCMYDPSILSRPLCGLLDPIPVAAFLSLLLYNLALCKIHFPSHSWKPKRGSG